MSGKKSYSVVPIYASALLWAMGVILLHPQNGTGYLICVALSAAAFLILNRVFPPVRETAANADGEPPFPETEDANGWDALEKASKRYAKQFAGKPVAASLLPLSKNIEEINRAIKADPHRAKNLDIQRFESIFVEYCKDLAEYEACSNILDPGDNVKNILQLTEERFAILNAVSKALVDEAYSGNVLLLSAGNNALKPLFAVLQSKSDFEIGAGGHIAVRTEGGEP